MAHEKKHRNILYAFVFILIVIQTFSFFVLSAQVSQLNVKIDDSIDTTKKNLTASFMNELDESNRMTQGQLSEISTALAQQQKSFAQEIKLLKSSQQDFSNIVDDAVKGVVSIVTDKSAATGFIVYNEGFIVTNHHVISGATKIRIVTYNNDVLDAQLIGSDEIRDIALLKIFGSGYDELNLADSDELQVGRKVIAIGNPLGLSFTVTEGIISALDREGPNGLKEYIQTDVSLNPGNSGGPLIDTNGEVVGINNFKVGGGAEGLGFALESNSIKEAVNKISDRIIVE